ncbi:hypothetical protein Tco_1405939 [Tanacetum coccineum]
MKWGVSSGEVGDMARHMCCSVGEFPFMYLGLPIGANMRRVTTWRPVVEKVKKRLYEWRAKTMSFGGRLTLIKSVLGSLPLYYFSMFRVKVIRSIHGSDEGLTGGEGCRDSNNRGVWIDIVRVGQDIDEVGIEFTSSIVKKVGSGNNTAFWIDMWVGNRRLCDIFPRWTLSEDNMFTVKSLARVVDEKRLQSDQLGQETVWNKLAPKKVNVFVWRVLKGRLPVLLEQNWS